MIVLELDFTVDGVVAVGRRTKDLTGLGRNRERLADQNEFPAFIVDDELGLNACKINSLKVFR